MPDGNIVAIYVPFVKPFAAQTDKKLLGRFLYMSHLFLDICRLLVV